MDFLFVQLMQWGRDQGYALVQLGLAPLSGIESRRLAPIWARIGALLYRHGDAFYGFEGLRAYKDKFNPRWEPRYIAGRAASPGSRRCSTCSRWWAGPARPAPPLEHCRAARPCRSRSDWDRRQS
jgi:hypothetical protein